MNGGTYNEGVSEINNMFSLLKSFCILANENKEYIGSFHLGFNIDQKNMLQGKFLTQEINRKTHDFSKHNEPLSDSSKASLQMVYGNVR